MKKRIIIVLIIVIAITTIFITVKNINTNDKVFKYDINKTVKELKLQSVDDYIEYLNDLKERIELNELKEMIVIDKKRANRYKRANLTQKQNGKDIINELVNTAYSDLINLIIQKNQDWSNLPLTESFKKKFSEKDGVIKECDYNYKSISKYSYDNKTFSIDYDWIPDDANKKYTDDEIEFMLTYGAGAYNLDRYNYQFVLDDKGYLDDIIFLGKTPVIVEGRGLEHPENNEWYDGDE